MSLCHPHLPVTAGKAIAAMMTNEGDVLDYVEMIGRGKPILHKAAPFIAVPTTSGTGSEVRDYSPCATHASRMQ